MEGLSSFLAMGGYAEYVWPAYGLTVLVLAVLAVASRKGLKAREAEVAALEATRQRRRSDGTGR